MMGALYTGLAGWLMLGDGSNGDRIMPGVTWRAFAVICALPAIVALLLTTCILPESPKHLVSKGKLEDAVRFVTQEFFIFMRFISYVGKNISSYVWATCTTAKFVARQHK